MSLDNKVVDLADLKVSHDYLLGRDKLLSDRINELGSGIDGIQSQITALGNGSPIPVETVAEMTDNTKAYLYTGSEQGYTSGYWYTYDSTQAKFVPRGEYGAGVIIDSTLTVTGNAADAKATGDAIKAVKTFVVQVPGSAAVLSGSITAGDFAKALAAYTAGSGVYAVKDGEVYQLSAVSSSTMTFTQMYHGTMNFIKQIQITSADTFTVTNTALSSSATDTSYSNTASGLTATNVQAAIDENAAAISNTNGRLQSQQLGESPLFDADVICYVPYYSYTAVTGQTWQGNMDAVEFSASEGEVYTMFLSDWNGTGTQRSIVRFFDSEDNILYTKYNDNGYNTAIAPAGTAKAQARAIAIGNSAPIVGQKYWFRNFLVVRGDITVNDKRISKIANDVSKLFLEPRTTSSIEWEKGYYSDRGTQQGGSFLTCIRSAPSDFIFCGAGSTYRLLSVANGERVRICRYSSPDESAFIERLTATNASLRTITEDCYIRVYLFYTDNREFTEEDWPTLINNFVLNAIQLGYVTKAQIDYLSGRVSNLESKIPALPTAWSDKIQTIQTAQGTRFTFAIQTDTHYYIGYGASSAYNLKLLTNSVGFDFVANLGDVSRGYADETIDSPANMRAAMTDIMRRYVTDISCPLMIAMGNHESNSMWANAFGGENFTDDELWGRMFRPSFNTNPKAVTQTGKMYYYTDFNDIRVIVLNTQDGANQGFGIGAEQLAWFRSTALNTDKWVLVMSHVPLINGWSVSSNYVSSYADIVDALVAYKANGGKVIACMSGHTHTKESQTVNSILFVTFRNGADYAETVMIDLEAKTINTIMLGASGDRSFSFA